MINASSDFKKCVKNGCKIVNYADITLKDGTVLNLGPSDFSVGGFSMTDKTSNGKFEIGTAIAKTISVTIANHTNKFSAYDFYKSIIYMYVAVEKEDGTVLKERKGKYYVINPTSPGDTIKLSGVDSMYLFDKPYNPKTFPATLQTILADCCIDCGVNIGFGEFDNWNFEVMNAPEECTYRQVVSWVAQIAGCHARINNNDYLELVWYDTSSLEKVNIDGGNYFVYENENIIDGGDFTTYESDLIIDGGNFTDYAPPNVTKIKPPTVSTDNVVISGVKVEYNKKEVLLGTEDYLISVKDNPFVADKEDEVCQYLADKLIGLSFRPLSCQMVNNPLFEPFDSCYVYDRKGNVYFTLINSVTYTISGFTTLSCNAEDPIRNETSYVSEAAKAVVQARREAAELANQAQIAAEKNAEAKAAELASEAASVAYKEAEKKAEELTTAAQKASGEEAARLAEEAQRAAEEAAQLKAEAAKAEAIAEAAREAAELANQALEEAKRYSDENLTMYDRAVQNMNLLAANSMGLYRESETQSDGSVIYYMSNRPIVKNEDGTCEFELDSVVYKMTADGFFVSEDGGITYTSGFDAEGNAVVNVLSAIGITFDWARGGTLSLGGDNNINGSIVVYDSENNVIGKFNKNGLWASNGYFEGDIVSKNAYITGGQININTSNETYDAIQLNQGKEIMKLSPGYFYQKTSDGISQITPFSISLGNGATFQGSSESANLGQGTLSLVYHNSKTSIQGGILNTESINADKASFAEDVSIAGDLFVSGAVTSKPNFKLGLTILNTGTLELQSASSLNCHGKANFYNGIYHGTVFSVSTTGEVTASGAIKSVGNYESSFYKLKTSSDLNVGGNLNVSGTFSPNSISLSGDLTVSGTTTLKGTVKICDATYDNLGFFGSSGSSKKTVSNISSTSGATTSTIATKLNDLLTSLRGYGLIG